jgi:hypothetical protein
VPASPRHAIAGALTEPGRLATGKKKARAVHQEKGTD